MDYTALHTHATRVVVTELLLLSLGAIITIIVYAAPARPIINRVKLQLKQMARW